MLTAAEPPPPVAETALVIWTLPLTPPVSLKPVELFPITLIVPACSTSPCTIASSDMPKELLPWTVMLEPLALLMVPTSGLDPVSRTP